MQAWCQLIIYFINQYIELHFQQTTRTISSLASDMNFNTLAHAPSGREIGPSPISDGIALTAKHRRGQIVLLKQPIEFGAIAIGNPGRVSHIAIGQLQ